MGAARGYVGWDVNICELRNIALQLIGTEDRAGSNSRRDFILIDGVASSLRLEYPFKTTSQLTFPDLLDTGFTSIETITAILTAGAGTTYPLQSLNRVAFNQMVSNSTLDGAPSYYCFEQISTPTRNNAQVKTYPLGTAYTYVITGIIDRLSDLNCDTGVPTELDPLPMFFQMYFLMEVSNMLAPLYNKEWTLSNQRRLMLYKRRTEQNANSNSSFDVITMGRRRVVPSISEGMG